MLFMILVAKKLLGVLSFDVPVSIPFSNLKSALPLSLTNCFKLLSLNKYSHLDSCAWRVEIKFNKNKSKKRLYLLGPVFNLFSVGYLIKQPNIAKVFC